MTKLVAVYFSFLVKLMFRFLALALFFSNVNKVQLFMFSEKIILDFGILETYQLLD